MRELAPGSKQDYPTLLQHSLDSEGFAGSGQGTGQSRDKSDLGCILEMPDSEFCKWLRGLKPPPSSGPRG